MATWSSQRRRGSLISIIVIIIYLFSYEMLLMVRQFSTSENRMMDGRGLELSILPANDASHAPRIATKNSPSNDAVRRRNRNGIHAANISANPIPKIGLIQNGTHAAAPSSPPLLNESITRAPLSDGISPETGTKNSKRNSSGVHVVNISVNPFSKIGLTKNTTLATVPTSSTSPPTPPPTMLQGTMVLQLMGELGNHLSSFAYYFAVQTIASTEFNLNLTLHVRKQKSKKANSAARNVQCLKSFRYLNFDECDWDQTDDDNNNNETKMLGELCVMKISNQSEAFYDLMRSSNNQTISKLSSSLSMNQRKTSNDIRSSLRDYVAMLQDDSILQMYRTRNVGWNSDEPYPFLYNLDSRYSDRMVASDALIDEFYSRGLPQYFAFDADTKTNGGCCAMLPTEDEQVFHYRSFVTDLPFRHMRWGGAELKPQNSAEMLSSALPPETRIALVTGRANRDRIVSYANAFRNHSFRVREIAGQSAIQDFCFLAHARAGLWGTVQSSYARWASLIGGELLRNATIYGVNYPAREVNVTSLVSTNEDLAGRIHYPVFDVTDSDVW